MLVGRRFIRTACSSNETKRIRVNTTNSGSSSNAFPVPAAKVLPVAKQVLPKRKRKSISQNDREVWGRSFLAFPVHYPLLLVAYERCPRVCNCLGCNRPIKCGDQRLHFYLKVSPKENRQGGVIQRRSMFLHPACFFGKCEANAEDAVTWGWGVNRCYDCHQELSEEDYGCYFASPGIGSAALCLKCTQQPRWRKCHSCCMFFLPPKVVRAPDDPTNGITWLCKTCKQQFNFPSFDDAQLVQTEIVDEMEFFEAFKTAVENGETPPPMPKHMVRKMRMADRRDHQFALPF